MGTAWTDLRGCKGVMSPQTWPNKFQERPCGASIVQENLLAAGENAELTLALPRIQLGELTALPDPLAGGEGTGCPLHKNTTPVLDHLDLGLWPFGPRPRREIGGLAPLNIMGLIR